MKSCSPLWLFMQTKIKELVQNLTGFSNTFLVNIGSKCCLVWIYVLKKEPISNAKLYNFFSACISALTTNISSSNNSGLFVYVCVGISVKPFKVFADMWARIIEISMTGCLLYHWSTFSLKNAHLLTALYCLRKNLRKKMKLGGELMDLKQKLWEKGLLQGRGIFILFYRRVTFSDDLRTSYDCGLCRDMITGIKLSFNKQNTSTSSLLVYHQNAVLPLCLKFVLLCLGL